MDVCVYIPDKKRGREREKESTGEKTSKWGRIGESRAIVYWFSFIILSFSAP